LWAQALLTVGALAAGASGALSAQPRRVLLGALVAAALLAPAADARLPLSRLPFELLAAVLFILFVELALLHAKVARLATLPRAHMTQLGQSREVELRATAHRIVGAWPKALAGALALLGLGVGLQLLLGAQDGAPWGSLEARGPFGLALAAVVVVGLAGFAGWRRLRAQEAGGSAGGVPGGPPEGG
jgi:hypothetical protein